MFDQPESAIVVAVPRQPTVDLLRQANLILQLKQKFKRDVHYGPPYPGSKKDTLLKPGAELLARRFGIRPRYETVKEVLTINPVNLAESVIIYIYRCEMIDIATGAVVGEAIGACSSLEDKYRFRTLKRSCPDCGQQKIMKSKYPDKQTGEYGWYCNACKHNFAANEPRVIDQPEDATGVNPNPVNELNTIIKMAQKRAMVSAVLVATGASAYFAPGDDEVKDLYDTPAEDGDLMEGEWEVIEEATPESFPGDDVVLPPAAPKPAHKGWASEREVSALVNNALTTFGVLWGDVARYVGIEKRDDFAAWNAKYETRKAAAEAIKSGFEADMAGLKPAAPKQETAVPV